MMPRPRRGSAFLPEDPMSTLQRCVVLAILCAAVPSAQASTRHHPRHMHRHVVHPPSYGPYGQPVYIAPYGSRPVGPPLYSTCDRINTDRMLVGTCR
jgi:hypothetical protein